MTNINVIPAEGVDLKDKVVLLCKESFSKDYQAIAWRLWIVNDGFGCDPKNMGRALFCTALADGEKARFNRRDVEGYVDATVEEVRKMLTT